MFFFEKKNQKTFGCLSRVKGSTMRVFRALRMILAPTGKIT